MLNAMCSMATSRIYLPRCHATTAHAIFSGFLLVQAFLALLQTCWVCKMASPDQS